MPPVPTMVPESKTLIVLVFVSKIPSVAVIVPVLMMPPKGAASWSAMPVAPPEIVPLLLMAPAKVEVTPSTSIPTLPVIEPVLVMPPLTALLPKCATDCTTMPPLNPVIVPLLVMPPKKVETWEILRPRTGAKIVPLLVMPPVKVGPKIPIALLVALILLVRSSEMPPLIVPVVSAIPPLIVLPLVNPMPFGLIVPVLKMVLVMVELLMAMPVMAAELVQPVVVSLL